MPTIIGDDSGYIVDIEAAAVEMWARNWQLRKASDPPAPPQGQGIFPPPVSECWEVVDRKTGEVIGVSAEVVPDLAMGALGSLLGELLPDDRFQKIVRVSPLPPSAGK